MLLPPCNLTKGYHNYRRIARDSPLLESQVLSYQNHFDSSGRFAVTGNQNLIANAGKILTITTGTSRRAGIIIIESLIVHGCSNRTGAVNGIFQGILYLVHTGYDNNALGSVNDGCNAVTGTVDIDHLAIQTDGIGTGQENVSKERPLHGGILFLSSFKLIAVNGSIRTVIHRIQKADLLAGNGSAPAHTGTLRNQLQGFLQRRCFVRAVICIKMALLQVLYQQFAALFII